MITRSKQQHIKYREEKTPSGKTPYTLKLLIFNNIISMRLTIFTRSKSRGLILFNPRQGYQGYEDCHGFQVRKGRASIG